jgi:cell wall-associated NlpC family hydrolase
VNAGANEIVNAARSQIGVPYSYGGGGGDGPSYGIGEGAGTWGFDCSGLAQYAVYQGTGKPLARTASTQYVDSQCYSVDYSDKQPGDLVFFYDGPGHVGIVSGNDEMIDSPNTGSKVREEQIWSNIYHQPYVRRCW